MCGCRRTRSSCRACERPCSGPTTWTMPPRGSPMAKFSMPCRSVLLTSASSCARASISATPAGPGGLSFGRDIMIRQRERPLGPADPPPRLLERGEGLRRRHFVQQVQIDIEQGFHHRPRQRRARPISCRRACAGRSSIRRLHRARIFERRHPVLAPRRADSHCCHLLRILTYMASKHVESSGFAWCQACHKIIILSS